MSASSSLQRRVLQTVLPAVIGCLIGYAYARLSLPTSLLKESSLPAMYGACGAAIMILSVRLATVLRLVIGEWRGRRGPPPEI